MKNYNLDEIPYDQMVDMLIEGSLTSEQVEVEAMKRQNYQRKSSAGESLDRLDSRLTNEETGSFLDYYLKGELLVIAKTESELEGQGGFSLLLSQLEEIAKENKIKELGLDVWRKKDHARRVYAHKGFKEIQRDYHKDKKDYLIFMQKKLT